MKDSETHELELIRDYPVPLTRLWRAVTEPRQLIQWFGPEGLYIGDDSPDFSRTGPWSCTMIGKESGDPYVLSGEVTSIAPPTAGKGHVAFTWGWHGPDGRRGAESHVTFTVEATDTGARLTLTHVALPDLETAQSHSRGWLSTLRSLDYFILGPQTETAK
ncbi:SRPBCC family protein [Oceanicola sp. S124]|uniref:SRPBCC family protein n=1 Tax=Oceanicola sp. S124 TaxID=1042378 RepID=UPI0002558629|nr:SRPBCC domain-containing protein [Oceanicola sp. S124]